MQSSLASSRQAISKAYYVKLGEAGRWAAESIERGILRFGWSGIPLADIHANDWASIRANLELEQHHKPTVTTDVERLRDLATSTSGDVWVAFHASHLWWCRLAGTPVEQDAVSKFRRVADKWRNCDIAGKPLLANLIPGRISQIQGFRGTVCSIRERAALERLLNREASEAYLALQDRRVELELAVAAALTDLHWKDFELLVDLVFRQSGWRRTSMVGGPMKFADLELEDPITGDRYQVQVKSKATRSEFEEYATRFSSGTFRKLYFVVHTPMSDLRLAPVGTDDVELVMPEQLSAIVLDAGLLRWVADKAW